MLKLVILTPKIVANIFEICYILMAAKNHFSNFSDSPFTLIILHLQMHPSLHPKISTVFQCIFEIFQIIVDFSKKIKFFICYIFWIFKYLNVIISVIFWHQLLAILCTFKHATKKKIKYSFKWWIRIKLSSNSLF